MDPKTTLKQHFERTRQAPPPRREQSADPLLKFLGFDVNVLFISGRFLEGELLAVRLFDLDIVGPDGVAQHVCKHAVERIHRK
jgi:hypothetical protein